jgi:glyoxylase-like metal-dependent hydrolase (beta-lactamase superfamily II)
MTSNVFQLYAIRYGTNPRRRRVENFLYHPPGESHDVAMPLDFFVWLAVGEHRTVLIDTGADEQTCAGRGTDYLCCPTHALSKLGVNPAEIRDIVTTHLHWDHAGNFEKFPSARFHLQAAELAHATNGYMADPFLRRIHDVEQVCGFLRLLYQGRVAVYDGEAEICPGIIVRRVGGHTPGTQIVEVMTQRGRVVLASDAMHYFENGTARNPFPGLTSLPESMAALSLLQRLAESPDHVIPGHDPLVMSLYPTAMDETGRAVRLDVMPRARLD